MRAVLGHVGERYAEAFAPDARAAGQANAIGERLHVSLQCGLVVARMLTLRTSIDLGGPQDLLGGSLGVPTCPFQG